MRRKGLPRIGDTPRLYVENTVRARVRSPELEHYRPRRRRATLWLAVAAVAILAALAWFYWVTLG